MKKIIFYILLGILLVILFRVSLSYSIDCKDLSLDTLANILTVCIAIAGLFFTWATHKKSVKEANYKDRKDLLERQPSFYFELIRWSQIQETMNLDHLKERYWHTYSFDMRNIGKMAKHLSFSNTEKLDTNIEIKEIELPSDIPILLNEETKKITFRFITENEVLCKNPINLNFKITYRDTLGEKRILPLIMTIEPDLNLSKRSDYEVTIRDDPKNIK